MQILFEKCQQFFFYIGKYNILTDINIIYYIYMYLYFKHLQQPLIDQKTLYLGYAKL